MEALIHQLHSISYPTIFITGIALRLWVGNRQFRRRGVGGLQQFDSYFQALFTLYGEWLLKWLGLGCILYGLWGWLFR